MSDYEKYMWDEKASCSYFANQAAKIVFAFLGVIVGIPCMLAGFTMTETFVSATYYAQTWRSRTSPL
jgi:hypothetical protein